MMTIPNIINVADLQRDYRNLVNGMKKSGRPVLVLSNGNPDVVVMDVVTYNFYVQQLNELEEKHLLLVAQEGIKEYEAGKTKTLKKGQKLLDLIH